MLCFLCEVPTYRNPILDSNRSAFVTPAVGGIATGHVLVSPRTHVRAVQSLETSQQIDFISILTNTHRRLHILGNDVTVFEHSAPGDDVSRRSACIDHAHIQVLPGIYSLREADGKDPIQYDSLETFYSGRRPYDGYLMHTNPDGSVTATRDIGRSQHFRQFIFEALGKPEEWDYALFPREGVTATTITLFER